jgi:hypothetical protein
LGGSGITNEQELAHGLTVRIGKRRLTRVARAFEKGVSKCSTRVVVNGFACEEFSSADTQMSFVLDAAASRDGYAA